MKKHAVRAALAAATLAASGSALAAGDSGTGSMGEMQLSGTHFLMMLGALVLLGVVIYFLAKLTSK
jgi:hypothetical protein